MYRQFWCDFKLILKSSNTEAWRTSGSESFTRLTVVLPAQVHYESEDTELEWLDQGHRRSSSKKYPGLCL